MLKTLNKYAWVIAVCLFALIAAVSITYAINLTVEEATLYEQSEITILERELEQSRLYNARLESQLSEMEAAKDIAELIMAGVESANVTVEFSNDGYMHGTITIEYRSPTYLTPDYTYESILPDDAIIDGFGYYERLDGDR